MKVRFFEDDLNILLLEASQPIPIGNVDNNTSRLLPNPTKIAQLELG